MKKISVLFCLCISAMLIFSSCGKELSPKEFETKKSFELQMTAEKNKTRFDAVIVCRNYNDMTFDFTYPEDITDFSVTVSNDGYSLDISGLEDTLTKEELSNTSLLNILTTAINVSVYSNNTRWQETAEGRQTDIIIDSVPVTVSFSSDGYISEINVPSASFYAQFQKSG